MRIEFASAAHEELVAALEYFERQSSGLGAVFLDDVEHAVERISAFPALGAPGPREARRVHLRRFAFALVYVDRSEMIWAVAVEHHRRKPGYWIERL